MENVEKIVETGAEMVTKTGKNWIVIGVSAAATIALTTGGYFLGKKIVKTVKAKKEQKGKKPEKASEVTEE